jgi:dTDP-4-dehydrorhamnose 3,5-epimerase-like enzyme
LRTRAARLPAPSAPSVFAAQGLASQYPQCNVSTNARRGTLRGLHLQADPHGEAKLIRATQGRVYDVALDLRPASPSYLQWAAVVLDAARHKRLIHSARLRARLPDPGGRQRAVLPDVRAP